MVWVCGHRFYPWSVHGAQQERKWVQKIRYLYNRDDRLRGWRVIGNIKEQLDDGEMDGQTRSPCPEHLEGYASSQLAGSRTEIAQRS